MTSSSRMWTASYGQHRERSRCRNGKIIIGNVSNENDETLTQDFYMLWIFLRKSYKMIGTDIGIFNM